MERKYITIRGEEYPARLTMGAMLRFKRATGTDISTVTDGDTAALVTFLHCCVASACAADGVPFTLTLEEFADHLTPADLDGLSAGEGKKKAPAAPEP